MNRKALGEWGERTAVEYIKRGGYRIRERNFRCKQGEIDIIAEEKGCLVFVEVRTRTGSACGAPEESVNRAKRNKLVATALSYLQTHQG
ncbi:MAG: YraN family protein, partial [Chloroflexi bacterium]|nr:YraN family protein [Chloroflexota bacterium]